MSHRPLVSLAGSLVSIAAAFAACVSSCAAQSLTLAGLRPVDGGVNSATASFQAVQMDSSRNLYLLMEEGDGVRLLKLNPAGTTVLASAHLGASGDRGTSLAVNGSAVYVAGTAGSGQMSASGGGAVGFTAAQSGFVAGFDSSLAPVFLTSTGGTLASATAVSATGGSVFVAGTIQTNTLPVTGNAVVFAFPANCTTTGFVEQFNSAGTALTFASYLGGPNGNTLPSAIAADSAGNMVVTGSDTATGFPTVNGIQPELVGITDMFLTKLSAGAGIEWSTLMGSAGGTVSASSLALSPNGTVFAGVNATTLGLPVTNSLTPVPVATSWGMILGFSADGSSVTQSTVLGDGSIRSIALDGAGDIVATGLIQDLSAWPLTVDLQRVGTEFVTAINTKGNLLYSTRVGGIAAYGSSTQQSATTGNGIAIAADGTIAVAGGWSALAATAGWLAGSLDLPMVNAPNSALPSTLAAVTATSACQAGSNPCGAAYLALLSPSTAAQLSLSVDTVPNLSLRNVGGSSASVTSVSATGYSTATDCTSNALLPGGACNIQLTGNGPGSVTIQASSGTVTFPVTGAALTSAQDVVPVQPREVVFPAFGSAPVATQTVVASNLTAQSQILQPSGTSQDAVSLLDGTCTGNAPRNDAYVLPANSTCTLTATFNDNSTMPSEDGGEQGYVTIQIADEAVNSVSLYGYKLDENHATSGGSGVTVSAASIDFGTNYIGGPHAPRSVVIANATGSAIMPGFVGTPPSDPNFTVTDLCPVTLAAYSSCGIEIAYASSVTSSDAATLTLPGGTALQLAGQTLQQPGAGGLTVNPSVAVAPASLSFGAVGIGDVATTQTVTVSNSGGSAVAVTVTASAAFTETNNCNGVVAANGSCTVQVQFAPSALGVVHGQLSVQPSGSSAVAVALTGGGTDTVNFGTVLVGEQQTRWISLGSFEGNVTATVQGAYQTAVVNGYAYNAPPAINFATSSTASCTTSCYVGVRAVPTTGGTQSGTLTVAEQNGATTTYPLTAASLSQSAAQLDIYSLSFGTIPSGSSSAPQLVTVTNSGNASISIGSVSVTTGFSLTNRCGSTLPGGASCVLAVAFAPQSVGGAAGTLSVAAGASMLVVNLSGNGADNPADVVFSPASVVFLSPAGASSQSVTLSNRGSAPVVISPIAAPGLAFYSTSSNCSTLQPSGSTGSSCTVQVSVSSIAAGTDTILPLPVTATIGGVAYGYQIAVSAAPTGLGLASQSLQVTPAQLSFSTQSIGQASSPEVLTITNNAGTSQVVNVTGPAQFSVDNTSCLTLAAGASCQIPVRFIPASAGTITGTIQVQGTGAVLGVQATGFGIAITHLAAPAYPPLIEPIVLNSNPQGDGFTQLLKITNAGAQPLIISGITAPGLISGNACTAPVPSGASCNVTLATTVNDYCGTSCSDFTTNETVTILSNAASSTDSYTVLQTHSGENGEATLPGFQVTADSLTFGLVALGHTASQTFQLQSIGSGNLSVAFTTTGDFTEHDDCGGQLIGSQGGGSNPYCTVTVVFSPSASGFRAGTLQVATSGGLQTVTLAGSGPAAAGPVGTSTALSSSASNVAQGQSVTLTARVTPASGSGTPTGNVVFSSQGVSFATVSLTNGSAAYTASTATLGAANYPVTAHYNGDTNDAASTSPIVTVTVTASLYSTTTALSASPRTVAPGNPVTLSVAVVRGGASGSPGGTVQFYSGSTLLGSTSLIAGAATFTLSTQGLPSGSYSVVANYLGDSTDHPSSSTSVTITVQSNIAATQTILAATPASVTQGGAVTLRATVSETGGSATPTGTVSFYYGTLSLGSAPITSGSGQIVTTTGSVPPGSYGLTAVYSGDSANASSTSAAVNVVVKAPTRVSLTATPTSVSSGQSVTLTATVAATSGTGTPGGSVSFSANGTTLGSATVVSGVAGFSAQTTGFPAGTYNVVANYLGDNADGASTSAAVAVTIH